MKLYDVIFIGSGACFSEFLSLIKNKNLKVLLIENKMLGGNCLNYTCLPVQYLFEGAKLMKGIKEGYYYGVVFDVVRFDYKMFRSQMIYYIEEVKEKLKKKMEMEGVDVVYGTPKIDGKVVMVGEESYSARSIIVSHNHDFVFKHNVLKVDNHTCFLAQRFVDFKRDLKRVVVYGNKSFAYSLATMFANLSNIEVFYIYEGEFLEDLDISSELKDVIKRRLIDQQINVVDNKSITSYYHKDNKAFIEVESYGTIEYIDAIFVEGEINRNEIKDLFKGNVELNLTNPYEIEEGVYLCGEALESVKHTTANEFYVMDEIANHMLKGKMMEYMKNSIYIRGFPSISYVKPKHYDNVVEIRGNEYPLARIFNIHEDDIIRVFLHQEHVVGYEIASLHADVIGMYLNVFINHNIRFEREHIFNPHYLMLLRKLDRY